MYHLIAILAQFNQFNDILDKLIISSNYFQNRGILGGITAKLKDKLKDTINNYFA